MTSSFAWLFRVVFERLPRRGHFASVALLSVLLSACQGPLSSNYLENGVGAQLSAADSDNAGALQTKYFRYLCEQSGYSSPCSLPLDDERKWTLIVSQGMNDIDRRCDAYLEWLDNRKRSKAPLLSEVSDVQKATTAVLSAVSPGSKAISLVGYAFGLLTDSIENYHSRLLLEVESSTINSVVLMARHDFRQGTFGTHYQSRPDAEYALRSYLRLCLPFAIETNINDYSTLGSRGIPVTQNNTINQVPVGAGQVIGDPSAGPPREFPSKGPIPSDPTLPNAVPGAVTYWERNIQSADLTQIQDYLCVEAANAFGPKTRAGILMLALKDGVPGADNLLNSREGGLLVAVAKRDGACMKTKYSNIFERLVFLKPADEASFYKKLVSALAEGDPVLGTETLEEARPLVVRYYERNKQFIMDGATTAEVTPRMYKRIISTPIAP